MGNAGRQKAERGHLLLVQQLSLGLLQLASPLRNPLLELRLILPQGGVERAEVVADALRHVMAKHGTVKFLGSYPVGGPAEAGAERRQAVSRAARKAAAWVDGLRGQIRDDA